MSSEGTSDGRRHLTKQQDVRAPALARSNPLARRQTPQRTKRDGVASQGCTSVKL